MYKEFLIKVTITIIVSALTWLFIKFIDLFIIPCLKKLSYSGAEIKGIWTGNIKIATNDGKNNEYHEDFNLTQVGQKIKGTYDVRTIQEDKSYCVSHYKVEGTVIQNYITLTCIVDNKREIGVINFLLQISSGGDKMIGHSIWLNRDGIEIETTKNVEFNFQN